MVGGAAGGFFSGVGVEATGVTTGWDDEFDWWRVGASTVVGAAGGTIFLRPGNAPSQVVTHYSSHPEGIPHGSWVQVGKPGVLTRLLSGKVWGAPNAASATVPEEGLVYPSGIEYCKGWIGQRKWEGPSIPQIPFR